MKSHALIFAFPLVAAFAVSGSSVAFSQPGMTPPGSTPPYSAPPGPAGPPAQPGGGGYGPSPYYGPPMPPPPRQQERSGFTIGLSGGMGSMESDAGEFACAGCEPIAGTFDLHVGTMLSPRFALQGEVWFAGQSLEEGGTASINQTMILLAAQYWLHPRFWIKAGLGGANLTLNYDDGFGGQQSEDLGSGTAMHLGVGYEIVRSSSFSFDAQLLTGVGSYTDRDERVSATSVNLGLNWY